jgi:anti-sigma B factor antagonist
METHEATARRDDVIFSLVDEVDAATAPLIDEHTSGAVQAGRRHVVFDLSGVTFMDSQGVNALLRADRTLAAVGGRLRLRAPSPPVRLVLRVAGVDHHVPVEG